MNKRLGEAPLYLGGWLILVGFRLFFGILAGGNSLLRMFSILMPEAGQTGRLLLVLIILYQFIIFTLFCKRHKAFKRAYIGLEALSAIFNLSLFFIPPDSNTVSLVSYRLIYIALMAINILWLIYAFLSRRVRKTFVCGWNETPDARLVNAANNR